MAYSANIPQPTDLLSQSQPLILGNFQAIQTGFDIDHVSFDASGEGKHKKVSLPPQSPAPTFDAGDVGLYSFLSPVTAKNELYINKTNQVTVKQIPATASILSVTSAPANGASGWTYLPSGILIKWGTATVTSTSGTPNQTVTYPVAATIPVFNQVFSVQATVFETTASDQNKYVYVQNMSSTTTFGVIAVSRTTAASYVTATFNYIAIGY
jgi:hypothetical protein